MSKKNGISTKRINNIATKMVLIQSMLGLNHHEALDKLLAMKKISDEEHKAMRAGHSAD